MPTVFLSYRHENSAHRDRVRQLALTLRDRGLKIILDQFANEEEFDRGGPPEGWGRWSMTQASEADRVLIVASAGWFRCFRKEEKAGVGLGAAAEAGVIQQRLYDAGGKNRDIRVAFFELGDLKTMPHELADYHRFDAAKDFADLVAWLKGGAPSPTVRQSLGAQSPALRQFLEEAPSIAGKIWEPSRVLVTTIGVAALSNSPIGAALDAVKEEIQSRGIEVELADMESIRNRFWMLDPTSALEGRFRYRALIVLIGSDWDVESTKQIIAGFRRDLEKRGPPMYCFNFLTFPLHRAVTFTTGVATVDELREHIRQKVLKFILF